MQLIAESGAVVDFISWQAALITQLVTCYPWVD